MSERRDSNRFKLSLALIILFPVPLCYPYYCLLSNALLLGICGVFTIYGFEIGFASMGGGGLNTLGCMNFDWTDLASFTKSRGGRHCLRNPKSKGKLKPTKRGTVY